MGMIDNSPEAVAARLTEYKQAKAIYETKKPAPGQDTTAWLNAQEKASKQINAMANDGAVQKALAAERAAAAKAAETEAANAAEAKEAIASEAALRDGSLTTPTAVVPDPVVAQPKTETVAGTLNPPPASSYVPTASDGRLIDPDTGEDLSAGDNQKPSSPSMAANSDAAPDEYADIQQGQTESAPATREYSDGTVAILCARGTTLLTHLGSHSKDQSAGFYAIEEWVRNPAVTNSSASSNGDMHRASLSPVLFTGVSVNRRDVFSQTLCLDNIKVFYSFGQNFGDITISGEILLGNAAEKMIAGHTVKVFADFFWKYRVSNYLYPVTVSAVNEKYMAYLVGMDFGEINPEYHILPFVLHGVLLDITRDSQKLVNPSSQVLTLKSAGIYNSSIAQALAKTTSVEVIDSDSGKTVSSFYKNPNPKTAAGGTPSTNALPAISANTTSPIGKNATAMTPQNTDPQAWVNRSPEALAASGRFDGTELGKAYKKKQEAAVMAQANAEMAKETKAANADQLQKDADKLKQESDKAGMAAKNELLYTVQHVTALEMLPAVAGDAVKAVRNFFVGDPNVFVPQHLNSADPHIGSTHQAFTP